MSIQLTYSSTSLTELFLKAVLRMVIRVMCPVIPVSIAGMPF